MNIAGGGGGGGCDFLCAISSVLALTVSKGNGQNYGAKLGTPLLTARLVVSIGTPFSAILEKMVSHLHSPLPNIRRLGLVVRKVDSAIHWINLYPVDNTIGFPNTYLLDSDYRWIALSNVWTTSAWSITFQCPSAVCLSRQASFALSGSSDGWCPVQPHYP